MGTDNTYHMGLVLDLYTEAPNKTSNCNRFWDALQIGSCVCHGGCSVTAGTLLVTLSDDSSSSTTSTSSPAAMGASSIHGSSTLALNTTAAAVTAAAAARSGPSHSVIGDLLCLVSAGFYAGYTIVLRKSLPDDDEANVALFFGYVGLLCSVVFAPVVAVLAGLGTMHLKSIPTKAYLIILVEGEAVENRLLFACMQHRTSASINSTAVVAAAAASSAHESLHCPLSPCLHCLMKVSFVTCKNH